jgi:hypothetical protein
MKLFRTLAAIVVAMATMSLFAAPAAAQATRTWVSGVGDDANPCSRTAPCKTFAGAISKTAAFGEINCLDPGGFGALTITKSITISCETGTAGVLVSGTNGFVVSAASTDVVVLKGLDFEGLSSTFNSLDGVKVLTAASVTIDHCIIAGFGSTNGVDGNGVFVNNSSSGTHVSIIDTLIINNAHDGVLVKPAGSVSARVSLRNVQVSRSGADGVMFDATGTTGSIKGEVTQSESAHNTASGFGVSSAGADDEVSLDSVAASDDSVGVTAIGAGAIVRFTRSTITANGTGATQVSGGSALSYSTNSVDGNGGGGNGNFGTTPQN